jgi:hypothetical protein
MMNVVIVAGDFSYYFDDDYYTEFINGISFNGVTLSTFCQPSPKSDDYYYGDDCELRNHVCGDFDITAWIKDEDDGANGFAVTSNINVESFCGQDDDTAFMTVVTFYCAGDSIILSGTADLTNTHSFSTASSSSSALSYIGSALALLLSVVGGVVAGSLFERRRRDGFMVVADSSAHASVSMTDIKGVQIPAKQAKMLPDVTI